MIGGDANDALIMESHEQTGEPHQPVPIVPGRDAAVRRFDPFLPHDQMDALASIEDDPA